MEDVRRAADYYRDKLGFDVTFYEADPDHYAYASRGAVHLHFARISGTAPRPHKIFAAYVYVDDVDALHGELVERGAEIIQAPMEQPYGLRELRVRDPDGYVLAFGTLLV